MYKHAITWSTGLETPNTSQFEKNKKRILEACKHKKTILGKVHRIEHYGVIVKLGVGCYGLLHISEITNGWVDNPGKYFSEKQEIKVNVLSTEINEKEKKIKVNLSTKNLGISQKSVRKVFTGKRRKENQLEQIFTAKDLVEKFNKKNR